MYIFALFDKKSNKYMPFMAPSIFAAKEGLFYDLQEEHSVLSEHPADFELYRLGSINLDCGILYQVPSGTDFICNCADIKNMAYRYDTNHDVIVNTEEH